jgi:hypothetical protein
VTDRAFSELVQHAEVRGGKSDFYQFFFEVAALIRRRVA